MFYMFPHKEKMLNFNVYEVKKNELYDAVSKMVMKLEPNEF